MQHLSEDLIRLFNQLFLFSENTELIAGGEEPIYLPCSADYPHHRIIFSHDYFASALHEISHWCIAGAKRRQQVDYGYWYNPDGRTIDQQMEFAQVEAKPQALEWLLTRACGAPFFVSLDNLQGDVGNITPFKQALLQQVKQFQQNGLSLRAEQLIVRLSQFYQQEQDYRQYTITLEELR